MTPPDQGFRARHGPRRDVDHRLIMQLELPAIHGPAEILFHPQTFHRPGARVRQRVEKGRRRRVGHDGRGDGMVEKHRCSSVASVGNAPTPQRSSGWSFSLVRGMAVAHAARTLPRASPAGETASGNTTASSPCPIRASSAPAGSAAATSPATCFIADFGFGRIEGLDDAIKIGEPDHSEREGRAGRCPLLQGKEEPLAVHEAGGGIEVLQQLACCLELGNRGAGIRHQRPDLVGEVGRQAARRAGLAIGAKGARRGEDGSQQLV